MKKMKIFTTLFLFLLLFFWGCSDETEENDSSFYDNETVDTEIKDDSTKAVDSNSPVITDMDSEAGDIAVGDSGGTSGMGNLPSSIVFKSIPGGTFTMGDNSINSARKNITATEHEVTVSGFEVSETEVTTAQFAKFFRSPPADKCYRIV